MAEPSSLERSAKHVINEEFTKNYNENNIKGYIFEVDVKYPKRLHELHSDLPFLLPFLPLLY